jgi:hypothetical protein
MEDEEQGAVAGWTLFGVLFSFKILTAIIIFIMFPSIGSAVFLFVFHWFWFIPFLVLGYGAVLGWRRLIRMRARREQLRRAEFFVEER